MATKQIGKLKYNISKRGIAYKWGDGEIHRFAFQKPREEPEEAYENEQPYDEGGYDDGYGAPYDDGYENGYDQEGYEEGYDDEYPAEEYPSGFLFDNDWVMWAALAVLPPLGIYILWKKQKFEMPVRTGISAASAIWFVLLLVLLFSNLFGGSGDVKQNPSSNITQTATYAPIPTPKATTAPTPVPTATPAPTPRPDSSISNTGDGSTIGDSTIGGQNDTTVYMTTLGKYYHKQSTCDGMDEGTPASLTYAQERGKTACPTCFGMGGATGGDTTTGVTTGDTFYSKPGGTWFHAAPKCDKGLRDGQPITRAEAEAAGQIACPECLGVYSRENGEKYHAYPHCSGLKDADIVSLDQAKYREQVECEVCHGAKEDTNVYYHTTGGDHYHSDPLCSNMKNAVQTNRETAVALGQTPCEKCVGKAVPGATYYWNDGGKNYHADKNCQNVTFKNKGSKAAAENNGKTACPTCIGVATTSGGNKVYFTKDGQWYHIDIDCQGMKNAVAGTVEQAKQYNKTACPDCIGSSSAKVYGRKDGQYYHVVSDCSGMTGAGYISVKVAQEYGLTACPKCIGGNKTTGAAAGTTTGTATGTAVKAGYTSNGEKIEVYCTEGGKWYHSNATCTDMVGAQGTTIARATKAGKTACPTCLGSTTSKTVYGTKYGYYYHTNKTCSGMAGAVAYNVATAAAAGKVACPVCIGATDTKVFLTKNGASYHVKSNCSGMSDPEFVTLKDALALGKDMCLECVGTDSALHKKYGAEIGGPESVGNTEVQKPATNTGNNNAGNTNAGTNNTVTDSGFTVYCTQNGTYYHTDRFCGPMSGAKATTLTAAAKAGKQPCPDCVAPTSENAVYCRSDSRYYHTNSTCSGMTNASKVTVAIAKLNGKTACPTCAGGEIIGTTKPDTSDKDTTTGGTTITDEMKAERVYCTAGGAYYHKTANTCGMTNAQATTKERAVSVHGKSPCPDCYDLNTSGSTSVLTSVFWNPNGENFHLDDDCRGMKGAIEGTVAQAKAAGKTACPKCFSTETNTRVFTTASDKYFHNKSTCGGEKKTIATTYTKAVQAGKKGCPSCTGKNNTTTEGSVAEDGKVYATLTSVYYHSNSGCMKEELNGASAISLEKAKAYSKTACPDCY